MLSLLRFLSFAYTTDGFFSPVCKTSFLSWMKGFGRNFFVQEGHIPYIRQDSQGSLLITFLYKAELGPNRFVFLFPLYKVRVPVEVEGYIKSLYG